jgi:hypothetical protein
MRQHNETATAAATDEGSATVELVLATPALMLMLLVIVQAALWGIAAYTVHAAAGEAVTALRVVDGTAVVGYQRVAALTGVDGLELSAAGGDTVAVRLPVDVLGSSVTLAGNASVSINGNTLQMQVTELSPTDSVELPAEAQSQIDQLASAASVDVPLPPLPYDLSIDAARAESSGLAVDLSATDVPLSR